MESDDKDGEGSKACCGLASKDEIPKDQEMKKCCESSVSGKRLVNVCMLMYISRRIKPLESASLILMSTSGLVSDRVLYYEHTLIAQGSFKIFAVKA